MSRSYSNNQKRSSAYDFYIVTGRKIGDVEIAQIESERDSHTRVIKKVDIKIGGAPHLDVSTPYLEGLFEV